MKKMSIRNYIAIICIIVSVMLIACACTKEPAETTSETTAANTTVATTEETTEEKTEAAEKVTYKVTVVDENGAPLAGANVQLCSDTCVPGATDANGVATFTLEEADYTVKVVLEGYNAAEATFAEGKTEVTVTLTKVASETTEDETTKSETTESEVETTESETETTESESETTETETEAPLGSLENPIIVDFAWSDEDAAAKATVKVPANTTYYFSSYSNIGGMLLSINKGEATLLEGSMFNPPVFSIENATDAEAEYALVLTYPIGSYMNPEAIFNASSIVVDLAEGNNQGYYYRWFTRTEGTLVFTCPAIEGVEYDVILINTNSFAMAYLSDSNDRTVSIEVAAGDQVIIQVVTLPDAEWNYPALETTLEGEFIDPVGSQMNPVIVYNPQNIVVDIAEGNNQGVYYSWTTRKAGTFTVTCPAVDGVNYEVILQNLTTLKYAWLSESDNETVSLDVAAGDTVIIQVVAIPVSVSETEWNYPALKATLNGVFAAPVGTELNPEAIFNAENVIVNVPAGQGNYFYSWYSRAEGVLTFTCPTVEGVAYDVELKNMTTSRKAWLSESEDGTVSIDVAAGDEVVIKIAVVPVKVSDTEYSYPALETALTGSFIYPLRTMNNPIVIENIADAITANVPANTEVYYKWYNTEGDGVIAVTTATENACLTVNNLTQNIYGDLVEGAGTAYTTGAYGDEIQIVVSTIKDMETWTSPAGEVAFSIAVTPATNVMSESLEITVEPGVPQMFTGFMLGGKQINIANASGLIVRHNGEVFFCDAESNITGLLTGGRMGATFAIYNNSDAAVTVTVTFTDPVGSWNNPAELVIGENSANIGENAQGYIYTYTATEAGTLSITMPTDSQWSYAINNLTAGTYGDTQWSDSDPVVNPGTVTVNAGDEIQVIINTYDAENMFGTPAGTITFTAEFVAASAQE